MLESKSWHSKILNKNVKDGKIDFSKNATWGKWVIFFCLRGDDNKSGGGFWLMA